MEKNINYKYIFEVRYNPIYKLDENILKKFENIFDMKEYEINVPINISNPNEKMFTAKKREFSDLIFNFRDDKSDAGVTVTELYDDITSTELYKKFVNVFQIWSISKIKRIGYRIILSMIYEDYLQARNSFGKLVKLDSIFFESDVKDIKVTQRYRQEMFNITNSIYTDIINIKIPYPIKEESQKIYTLNYDIDVYKNNTNFDENDLQHMHNLILDKINKFKEGLK